MDVSGTFGTAKRGQKAVKSLKIGADTTFKTLSELLARLFAMRRSGVRASPAPPFSLRISLVFDGPALLGITSQGCAEFSQTNDEALRPFGGDRRGGLAEQLVQQLHHAPGLLAGQRIIDRLAVAPGGDQLFGA